MDDPISSAKIDALDSKGKLKRTDYEQDSRACGSTPLRTS